MRVPLVLLSSRSKAPLPLTGTCAHTTRTSVKKIDVGAAAVRYMTLIQSIPVKQDKFETATLLTFEAPHRYN